MRAREGQPWSGRERERERGGKDLRGRRERKGVHIGEIEGENGQDREGRRRRRRRRRREEEEEVEELRNKMSQLQLHRTLVLVLSEKFGYKFFVIVSCNWEYTKSVFKKRCLDVSITYPCN